MAKPILPPRYVNVPAGPAYDPDLPDGVFRTYVQLRGLAWGKERLDEVTVKEIMEVTGKSRSTIYGHLGILRDRGWLLFSSAHYSRLTVLFSGSDQDGDKGSFEGVEITVDNQSRFLDSLNEEVKELKENDLKTVNNLPPVNLNPLSAGIVQKSGQVSENLDNLNGWHDVIKPELVRKLDGLGVYRSLFGLIAETVRSGEWTLEQVHALADELIAKGGAAGPGVFVYRIRHGIKPESETDKAGKALDDFRFLARMQQEAMSG